MTAFVDTNVLLYADDRSGGAKTATAQRLIDDMLLHDGGRVSAQVLQEYDANAGTGHGAAIIVQTSHRSQGATSMIAKPSRRNRETPDCDAS